MGGSHGGGSGRKDAQDSRHHGSHTTRGSTHTEEDRGVEPHQKLAHGMSTERSVQGSSFSLTRRHRPFQQTKPAEQPEIGSHRSSSLVGSQTPSGPPPTGLHVCSRGHCDGMPARHGPPATAGPRQTYVRPLVSKPSAVQDSPSRQSGPICAPQGWPSSTTNTSLAGRQSPAVQSSPKAQASIAAHASPNARGRTHVLSLHLSPAAQSRSEEHHGIRAGSRGWHVAGHVESQQNWFTPHSSCVPQTLPSR